MLQMVAKKYTRALVETIPSTQLELVLILLKSFSEVLKEKSNVDVVASLSKQQKEQLLLESIGDVDVKIQNFFRLLAQSGRILLIPYIAKEIEKSLLFSKKEYVALLVSKEKLDDKTLYKIQDALAQKLGVNLSIKQEVSNVDGIRLSVDDLGVEVSFSRERFSSDLRHHILKAL